MLLYYHSNINKLVDCISELILNKDTDNINFYSFGLISSAYLKSKSKQNLVNILNKNLFENKKLKTFCFNCSYKNSNILVNFDEYEYNKTNELNLFLIRYYYNTKFIEEHHVRYYNYDCIENVIKILNNYINDINVRIYTDLNRLKYSLITDLFDIRGFYEKLIYTNNEFKAKLESFIHPIFKDIIYLSKYRFNNFNDSSLIYNYKILNTELEIFSIKYIGDTISDSFNIVSIICYINESKIEKYKLKFLSYNSIIEIPFSSDSILNLLDLRLKINKTNLITNFLVYISSL